MLLDDRERNVLLIGYAKLKSILKLLNQQFISETEKRES